MNVLKHMEAVFLVALALAGTATWATGHAAGSRATRAIVLAAEGSAGLAADKTAAQHLYAATRRAA
jgi:hypothetical protein